MQVSRVVVGRQAIQDRGREVVAYELLFRSAHDGQADLTGDQMTADVVFGALNIGLEHMARGKKVFCNADRGVLVGDVPITLPPSHTVVEVLETVAPDRAVVDGCRRLADSGFELALDDFVWFDGAEVLLDIASIVKIDVQATRGAALTALVDRCRAHHVRLLAEKVETEEEYERFSAMGFDLFQGYLLERPVVVQGRTIEAGASARVRMATTLLTEDLDLDAVDALLRTDPGLAYQVIQLATIGRIGETRRAVNTTRDALVLLGSRRVRNWLALLLARPAHPAADDGFEKTLMRARACELLAERVAGGRPATGFAAGLLSSLDLLFGVSPDELLDTLPLGPELADAAFGETTELARVVRDAVAYQLGTGNGTRLSGLAESDFDAAFAQAFVWAMQTTQAIAA